MLKSNQKSFLRAKANGLKAVVTVGKNGINDQLIDSLDKALEAHELVKVFLLKTCPMDLSEVKIELAANTKSEIVNTIGRSILLYRKSKESKLVLPK